MAISDLANQPKSSDLPWRVCQVCHALATIPDGEAAALRGLLSDPAWRYTEIRDAVAADPDTPLLFHEDALARHAKGRCEARERLRG
jgi:hypothetical protein